MCLGNLKFATISRVERSSAAPYVLWWMMITIALYLLNSFWMLGTELGH